MTDSTIPRGIPLKDLAELKQEAQQEKLLESMAESEPAADDFFLAVEETSRGFEFLSAEGARAVKAFKLLEVAQSQIGGESGTDELSGSEVGLLRLMLGDGFAGDAFEAYNDCKSRTRNLEEMHDLDERACWKLTEFIHLFEHVMIHGARAGRLTRQHAPHVLNILVHDFGEYFGMLCDDVADSKKATSVRYAQYLSQFRRSEHFSEELPIDMMTRLPLSDPLARSLLDYEIARGIEQHPVAVKECTIRPGADGGVAEEDGVEFVTHRLDVHYARDLSEAEAAIVNAILPVFAVSVFEGFASLPEAEAYIERRRQEIQLAEQQCFALLQCLEHYKGQMPARMGEFGVEAMQSAAQRVYRDREKARMRASKATTLTGMLKERVSGAFQAVARPVDFDWPENRKMYQVHGYPESIRFFPLHVTVAGETPEKYTFLCHVRADEDPRGDRPLMYEYQVVIGDGLLFDAHQAARDLFSEAPDTFKRTLQAGRLVQYAKDVVHAGEREASVDMEETKLLATFVALLGGMQSWMGQRYVLSDEGADIFTHYPDVRAYVSRLK